MKRTVYAVEDDTSLQEIYTYSLADEFNCLCFNDSPELFAALDHGYPDLIILDIMLPGEDGFAILSRLKNNGRTSNIPVIMISAKGEEVHKLCGLNQGAADYITKPFSVLEFIARVKANLPGKPGTENVEYKDIVFDAGRHRVTINGIPVYCTLKEYNLLLFLCSNAQKLQTRETLFSKVWDTAFIGETRTLDIHIKELRKKLKEAGSEAYIQTVRSIGYILL